MPDQQVHQKSSQVHYSSPQRAAGETTTSSFDDLAKGLASGTLSRGKALRLLGGALVGATLASLPGVAWAQGGGNSACVKCCKRAFEPGEKITVRGRERSARGYCISQSAKNRECYVPCEDSGNGDCPYGQELCQGECVEKCIEGQTLDPTTCECGGECPPGSLPPVSGGNTCGPTVVEGSCGRTCIGSSCTGEIICKCCPIGGPCPCISEAEFNSLPCVTHFQAACPKTLECISFDPEFPPTVSGEINIPCPGPHNPGCDGNGTCLEQLPR